MSSKNAFDVLDFLSMNHAKIVNAAHFHACSPDEKTGKDLVLGGWRMACYIQLKSDHWFLLMSSTEVFEVDGVGQMTWCENGNIGWFLDVYPDAKENENGLIPLTRIIDAFNAVLSWLETDETKRHVGYYSKQFVKLKKRVKEINSLIFMQNNGRKMNAKEVQKIATLEETISQMNDERDFMNARFIK